MIEERINTRKRNSLILSIFLIFFLSLSVSALTENPNSLIDDGKTGYVSGTSFWTSKPTEGTDYFQYNSKTATEYDLLVYDLDNDGTNEVTWYDAGDIKVNHLNSTTRQLDIKDVHTAVNMQDIGLIETTTSAYIVYIKTSGTLVQFESHNYNGTLNDVDDITIRNTTDLTANYLRFECGEFNGTSVCASFIIKDPSGGSNNDILLDIVGVYDNGTLYLMKQITLEGSTTNHKNPIVFPEHALTFADIDQDGLGEIVVPVIYGTVGNGDNRKVIAIDDDGTELWDTDLSSQCMVNAHYTSATVFNFDGAPSNGLEVLIACEESADQTNVLSLNGKTGAISLLHSGSTNLDGEVISNIAKCDCMEGSGVVDGCLLGYEDSDDQLELICVSSQGETSYYYTTDYSLGNVTTDIRGIYASEITASDSDDTGSELFTPYGVFAITDNQCAPLYLTCNIDKIFDSNLYGVHMPVDALQEGHNDIFVMTGSANYYLDDGFTNPQPSLDWQIDPCSPILVNETVLIKLSPSDPDGDDINITVSAYYENNERNKSYDVASGSVTYSSFLANVTASNQLVRIYYKDVEHTEYRTVDIPFAVSSSNTSNRAGDCVTTGTTESDSEDSETVADASFDTSVDDALDTVGLQSSKSRNLIGFILLILIAVVVMSGSVFGFNVPADKMIPALLVIEMASVFILSPLGLSIFSWTPIVFMGIFLVALLGLSMRNLLGSAGG